MQQRFNMLLVCLVTLALPMMGRGEEKRASSGEAPSNSTASAPVSEAPAAATPSPASSAAAPASSAVEGELHLMRELMDAQAKQLEEQRAALAAQKARVEALETELRATPSATTPAAAAVVQGPQTPGPQKSIEDRLKQIGPFRFSGDFRLRDEPFFGGPADQSMRQNRERFRLRFNADARLNDDVSGGFSLSTGDLNNPISTNQTTDQFYTRKAFALDRAFINYHPSYFKPLTLTGGKFAYPWYNTELTWDKDLNPEGLAQTLAFDLESTPVLKRVALVGFELPLTETAGVSLTNKSLVASAVYGGQLQTTWQLADWLKLSTYGGFYNWHNADPVALTVATANSASPVNGLLSLGGNKVQNSEVITTATSIVTINGTVAPMGVTKVVAAQFASKFALLDAIARFDIKTPYERWPVTIVGDYVQNTRACANVGNILPAPANTSTSKFSQSTNAPCDPHQRRGYWAEARFGRTQEKGDWQFAYTRIFIEREAVLTPFNYSEIRQGSNVTQHRVEALYQAYKSVQLAFTGFFGRPLNFGNSTPPENTLKRLQFDVVYKF
jgi:hypothetical protein